MNKINYKIAAIGLSILVSVGLVSCEDYLDKAPLGELTSENFFQDELQATQAVNAIYAHLRSFNVHVFSYIGVTDIARSEDVV